MKSAKGSDSLSKQNTGATMINTKTTLLKRGSSKTKKWLVHLINILIKIDENKNLLSAMTHFFNEFRFKRLSSYGYKAVALCFWAKMLSNLLDRLMDVVILFILLEVSSKTDRVSICSRTASGPRSAYSFIKSYSPCKYSFYQSLSSYDE